MRDHAGSHDGGATHDLAREDMATDFGTVAEDQGGTRDGGDIDGATIDLPPRGDAQELTTPEDTPLEIQLTGTDPEGRPLTFQVTLTPANGTLDVRAGGAVTYTPNRDFYGNDEFFFVARDATLESPPARIGITVTAENDPPVASDGSGSIPEDGDLLFDVGPLISDADPDDVAFSVEVLASPAMLAINIDGTILSIAHAGDDPPATLEVMYRACDDHVPAACDIGTIVLTVVAANDPPTAADSSVPIAFGGSAILDLIDLIGDPDHATGDLVVRVLSAEPESIISAEVTGTRLEITHNGSPRASEHFVRYEVCDIATPAACDTGVVTVLIGDPPPPGCDELTFSGTVWGVPAVGLDLRGYTGSTLHFFGCTGSGCATTDFFCEVDGSSGELTFGATADIPRVLVDPGNAAGDAMGGVLPSCASASDPTDLANFPTVDSAASALCRALGYSTGSSLDASEGNACPRAAPTSSSGAQWTIPDYSLAFEAGVRSITCVP